MFHLHGKVMQSQGKLSPHSMCTPGRAQVQTKSITLCHWVHELIQVQYPNADLKTNSPCRCRSPTSMLLFFLTTVRTFQPDKRDPESLKIWWLESQPASSCWYFSKYKCNVFLAGKVFLLTPHQILIKLMLCAKSHLCKGVKALRRFIAKISSPGQIPHLIVTIKLAVIFM